MFRMAVGHSDDIDPLSAVHSAIEQCQAALNGAAQPQAALLFIAADSFDPSLIDVVRNGVPRR